MYLKAYHVIDWIRWVIFHLAAFQVNLKVVTVLYCTVQYSYFDGLNYTTEI